MNDLKNLSADKHGHLFATLNPLSPPEPTWNLGRYAYSHPVLSSDAVSAKRALAQLNPRAMESGRHRAFVGAWARYGFHEDDFAAGLHAAAALPGLALQFAIADAGVECGEPHIVGKVARVFDVVEAMRVCTALLAGEILLVVAAVQGPVGKKGKRRWIRNRKASRRWGQIRWGLFFFNAFL